MNLVSQTARHLFASATFFSPGERALQCSAGHSRACLSFFECRGEILSLRPSSCQERSCIPACGAIPTPVILMRLHLLPDLRRRPPGDIRSSNFPTDNRRLISLPLYLLPALRLTGSGRPGILDRRVRRRTHKATNNLPLAREKSLHLRISPTFAESPPYQSTSAMTFPLPMLCLPIHLQPPKLCLYGQNNFRAAPGLVLGPESFLSLMAIEKSEPTRTSHSGDLSHIFSSGLPRKLWRESISLEL